MICLDLKDFFASKASKLDNSPKATKYQRFRMLRNLSNYINYFNFFPKTTLIYYFLGDGFFVGGLVVDDVDAGVEGGGTTTIGGEDRPI